MTKFIVYCAQSPSDKKYIGYTSRSLTIRKAEHYSNTLKSNRKFGVALRKYGNKIRWSILAQTTSLSEAHRLECQYIQEWNTRSVGYNCTHGGEGTCGIERSIETRQRMSRAQKGRKRKPCTELTKQKISLAKRGRSARRTKEASEKCRQTFITTSSRQRTIVRSDGKIYLTMREAANALELKYKSGIQKSLEHGYSCKGYKFFYEDNTNANNV